jgi:8-oxo-dGTP pyrophosphatase MutT (NUDIX family)
VLSASRVTGMAKSPMTADPTDRLAEFLAIGDNARNLPGVRIRDAATMIVVDRTAASIKVLLGRRHHAHLFMPGKYVFPGGRVEPADRRVRSATPLDPTVMTRLMMSVRQPSEGKARGLALAAVREMFEETGIALGVRPSSGDGAPPPNPEWARYASLGVVPDLAPMHFVARAITPPGRPRRFDARFFAVDAQAIAATIDSVVGPDTELVELVWLPIEDTLKLDMAGITMAVLEELKIRIAHGFALDLPVPFYRIERGRRLRELLA